MVDKKWRFREDIVFQYINGTSSSTFRDAENRLNYLEEKVQLPDMRDKVREYISELDEEIERCHKEISNLSYDEVQVRVNRAEIDVYRCRAKTLTEVKNDLQGRLDELI